MEKITFCIPSKSNLRYLKTCIPSIRNNASRSDHEIVIFVDQDEDGTIDWLEENKDKYNLTWIVNPMLKYGTIYGIGRAYDACIEKSTTEVFMIFHADMILGHNADLLAYNHLKEGTIVASTRIEPPLHPNGGEKILKAFGMYPEEFNEKLFGEFVAESANIDKTTNGIFAPWMMYKSDHQNIGGHDPRMHSCREDSDIFNRMSLVGYKFIQPWNSLVYHFTGRGAGSFSEDKARHEAWKVQMENSTREYIRKWKSSVKHTALMEPIIAPIYNTAIVVKNCNTQLLTALEPWSHNVYVDCDYYEYIAREKDNTIDDLFEKIKPIDEKPKNDILINIDGSTFNNQDFQFLQQIGDIIKNSGQIGKSKLGNILIEINQLNEIQNELCKM